jgi:outer membrane protein assembly factor BamB
MDIMRSKITNISPDCVYLQTRRYPVPAVLITNLARLLFSVALAVLFMPYMGYCDSGWPMFHHDAQHTGKSSVNGPEGNSLKWSYTVNTLQSGFSFESASISADGSTIYMVGAQTLWALRTSDGIVSWSYPLGGGGATAVASDGTVYAVGGTQLYAFTSAGSLKWIYAVGTPDQNVNIHGEPSIGADGTIYIGSWDTYVYAVYPNGTLKWRYKTAGSIAPLASPSLSPDGLTLYVGSGDANDITDGTLYAINTADGTLKWSVKIDPMRVSGAAVGPDGNVYVSGNNKVNAFSAAGTPLWTSAAGTAGSLTPALSSSANLIYVGTGSDGKVYALNASSGATVWSYQTGQNPVLSTNPHDPPYGVLTAPIIGSDDTVYIGAMDGKIHALKSDGGILWTYSTSLHITENCPAIGPDGALYFSSSDGYLYTIASNGSCLYTINPANTSFTAIGGTSNAAVAIAGTGCTWNAASSDTSWIHITSGSSGTGSGTVNFSVSANISPGSRTGKITIAGQSFLISQAGASSGFSVSGSVKNPDGSGIQGVAVDLTGSGSTDTTTDSSGNYSFCNLLNGSYTITPNLTGYTFSPSSLNVIVSDANLTGNNFTLTGTNCSNSPAMLALSNPEYFSSLHDAYAAAEDLNIIKAEGVNFTEDLNFDRPVSITLQGGYDCNYIIHSLYSTITGSVTISNGTASIENLIFK